MTHWQRLWLALLGFSIAACTERVQFLELPLGLKSETVLVAQNGKREKLMAHLKEVNLLFFGYTRCPDFCPMTLSKVRAALESDEELQQKTAVLFVSVDPLRDAPGELNRYLAPFPYARGFTGTSEEIRQLEKLFGAYSQAESDTISHSLYLYLLNREGRVIYLLRYDDSVEKIRRVLRQAARDR